MLGAIIEKLGFTHRRNDVILAFAVACIILLLVIPLTNVMLDLLISLSIVLAITTLLVTLYADGALSFNSFPSFLLVLTLFRLGLNIAATRMILTQAQAGEIIKTFGDVVTGGNPFVGLLIFILLTVINFVVITKGSGRVAEVAARFTLDALPGKQLAIDADLSSGVINDEEAKHKREKVVLEADFYGAMDGASKFVRGDAVAGMLITLVNIVGGVIVGLAIKGMGWNEVVNVYMTLAVGDGLVMQISALLVSVAAGIIVTRSSSKENLADSFRQQLFNDPRVLSIAATILVLLSFIPGMPRLLIWGIAGIIYLYAYGIRKSSLVALRGEDSSEISGKGEKLGRAGEEVEKMLFVDSMEIELGKNLIPLVNNTQAGNLLNKISNIRRQIAAELGIVVPSIRIHDGSHVNPQAYAIKIKGNEVANGMLHIESLLALNPGSAQGLLEGIETTEPTMELAAYWIDPRQKEAALQAGYVVMDPLEVLSTHLIEVIRSHAHELLNRQELSKLIENAREYASAVISELIPVKLNLGQLLHVLQNLLREGISIRDMPTILEILADRSTTTSDVNLLSEYVRQGLTRTISKQYLSLDKVLHAVILDPKVEQLLLESIQEDERGKTIVIHPLTLRKIVEELKELFREARRRKIQPILLVTAGLRFYLKKAIQYSLPNTPVLSLTELTPELQVHTFGIVLPDVLMQ